MRQFKKALITGASSGIGQAIARLLANVGVSLIITGRNESQLKRLKEELSVRVSVEMIAADLTDSEQLQSVLAFMEARACDLIINNAGFGGYGNAVDAPLQHSLKMMQLDVEAMTLIALKASKIMAERKIKGTILNVSSAASFFPFPGFAVYAASKGFVNQFSIALNDELKDLGIKVLVACPGVVKTHFAESAGGEYLESDQGLSKPMTAEFAAQEIWKQVQSGKALHIFDWRFRLMVFFSKLLPNNLLFFFLKKSLKKRKTL